jgi:hypothetical protein
MGFDDFATTLVSLQKSFFQLVLIAACTFNFGPMQQAMRIKGVKDAAPASGMKRKTYFGPTCFDVLVHLSLLLCI